MIAGYPIFTVIKILLRNILLFLLSVIISPHVNAQKVNVVNNTGLIAVMNYSVLSNSSQQPDEVFKDTTLPFIENDSLRPVRNNIFWIKVALFNPKRYAEKFNLKVSPYFNNTAYYYNEENKQWSPCTAGLTGDSGRTGEMEWLPVILQAQVATVVFVKVVMPGTRYFKAPVKPQILIEKQELTNDYETYNLIIWATSLAVLVFFFLNNLHVYFSFRDKTVLYFLIVQLGGMLYITSATKFFNIIFSAPFTMRLLPDGTFKFYNLNALIMHTSVLLIVSGFVQLARAYLNTKARLPVMDRVLKYSWLVYAAYTVVVAIINILFVFINTSTIVFENILVVIVMAVGLFTSILANVRKLPSANIFLAANILPMSLIAGSGLSNVISNFHSGMFFPCLAIISHALCFSVAIVARIRALRNELWQKENEARKLSFDIQQKELDYRKIEFEIGQMNAGIRQMETKNDLIEREYRQINDIVQDEKSRNIELSQKLEANQRQLLSTTAYLVQKNEMLAALEKQIRELNKLAPANQRADLNGTKPGLKNNMGKIDEDWSKFRLHFEQVHPDFFGSLQSKHPTLTKNEIRLHTYFYINLSTKEIALLLNIDPASVRRAKTRLYKKMGGQDCPQPNEGPQNDD